MIIKSTSLAVIIFFSTTLLLTQFASANECKENQEYGITLCGNWSEQEAAELITFLIGDEEIHKIIKKNDDYYFLHTCKKWTNDSKCISGFVYVIERQDGILVVRPEGWDWFSPEF